MEVRLVHVVVAFGAGIVVANAYQLTPRQVVRAAGNGAVAVAAQWRSESAPHAEASKKDMPFRGKPPRPALKPLEELGV